VERVLVVRDALASLSAAQLAVVYLHYWEDLTLDSVAAQLGVGVGTVRSHLDRAKRRLKHVLPDHEGELR
jgi:RNA polymerase sigma-70 factor (ECF subfamily)